LRETPTSLKKIAEGIKPPHNPVSQSPDDSEPGPSGFKTHTKTKSGPKKTRSAGESHNDKELLDQSSGSETDSQDEEESPQ
jgi:hypothetical protein